MAADKNNASSFFYEKKEDAIVLDSIFRMIDEDGDGRVGASDIVRFIEKIGLSMNSVNEVESILRAMSNSEYCDSLSLQEFGHFYHAFFEQTHLQNDDDEELIEAFKVFDENGDGVISAIELGNMLCKLGYEEHGRYEMHCRRMISRVDLNGDGLIDIHEFRHLLSPYTACVH